MKLNYKDLYKYWLESKQRQAPSSFEPIKENGMPAYWLNSKDMMAYLNSENPEDLYLRPDSRYRTPLDYPTSAFNMGSVPYERGGKPNTMLFAKSDKGRLSPIISIMRSMMENYGDIPGKLKRFVPQGIYEHERAHYDDPRIKFMTDNINPEDIAERERPAMQAEDRFWDSIRRLYGT